MEQKEKKVNFSKIVRVLSIPLLAFILWYIFLPAINLHSFEFWIYLIINLLFAVVILITFDKKYYKLFVVPGILFTLLIVLKLSSTVIFHSTKYTKFNQ